MKSFHDIYSIWFLTWIEFMKPDIAIIFLQFIWDTIISLLLYMSETNLIGKLETQEASQILKSTS